MNIFRALHRSHVHRTQSVRCVQTLSTPHRHGSRRAPRAATITSHGISLGSCLPHLSPLQRVPVRWAGHSKWANIKHRKGRQDAIKTKVRGKMISHILAACRTGGSNPAENPPLALAIQKAKEANVPRVNIERALQKAESGALRPAVYEISCKDGVGVIVHCETDSTARTYDDLKKVLAKTSASLASGSVMFRFQHMGQFFLPGSCVEEDELVERMLEAGAEDVEVLEKEGGEGGEGGEEGEEGEERKYCVSTSFQEYLKVKKVLDESELGSHVIIEESGLAYIADNPLEVREETVESVENLIAKFEELDDTVGVYHDMKL